MKWAALYRVAVVILLALILAQTAGLLDLRTLPHEARRLARDLRNINAPQELPAQEPGGDATPGLLRLHADGIEAAHRRGIGASGPQK